MYSTLLWYRPLDSTTYSAVCTSSIDHLVLLWVSISALAALNLLALIRCYIPPQHRAYLELVGRVEDLEFAHDEVRQRLTKRAKAENMATARTAHEARSARRDLIETEAAAILEGEKQRQAALPLAQSPADLKAALRQRLRLAKGQ